MRGRFDAERAYDLLVRYGVRNSFLFPTALKLMMKAVPEPKRRFALDLVITSYSIHYTKLYDAGIG